MINQQFVVVWLSWVLNVFISVMGSESVHLCHGFWMCSSLSWVLNVFISLYTVKHECMSRVSSLCIVRFCLLLWWLLLHCLWYAVMPFIMLASWNKTANVVLIYTLVIFGFIILYKHCKLSTCFMAVYINDTGPYNIIGHD